ncbi:MAG: hypothetical protein KatS3mg110_0993 [Pirellulaceae bacterium]|nr:MAG: hypothetical protein KatS3mg110_0993 [Pirellulaceae bacterium]
MIAGKLASVFWKAALVAALCVVCPCSWAEETQPPAAVKTEEHGSHGHAAGEGDHHDPYDLTHANASPKLTDVAELRFDHMIGSWLVFLLLFGVGGKLAWKPIVRGLEKREQAIAARIQKAEQDALEAAEKLKQYEAKLAQAADEARQLLAKAQQDAERRSAEILAAAEQAAARERDRAMAEIDAARLAALEQLTQRSAELAVVMATRILQRQLSPEDQRRLLGEALGQLTQHQ